MKTDSLSNENKNEKFDSVLSALKRFEDYYETVKNDTTMNDLSDAQYGYSYQSELAVAKSLSSIAEDLKDDLENGLSLSSLKEYFLSVFSNKARLMSVGDGVTKKQVTLKAYGKLYRHLKPYLPEQRERGESNGVC